MARRGTRGRRESEGRRSERAPAAPRISGPTLTATAALAAVAAAVFAFAGVFASSGGTDTSAIDDLGAALVLALTAPDPAAWEKNARTYKAQAAYVRRVLDTAGINMPGLPRGPRGKQSGFDHATAQHNAAALQRVADAHGGLARGVVRGLQVRLDKKQGPETAGVGLPRDPQMQRVGTVGKDVEVYRAKLQDPVTRAVFAARIYLREYKNRNGTRAGDAVAILSEDGLGKGGAGSWLFLTPLLVGLAGAGWVVVASKAAKGLGGLARDLDAVGRGRLDQRIMVDATGEVGMLQRTAEKMVRNLELIQSTGSGNLDEAVEKELSLAAQIHQSLRPQDPPRIPSHDVETLFKPGRDIGGDYFDYIELDGDRLALVIADVSESIRGVPAAMIMAMTRAYLKSAIDPATTPAQWLREVNRHLSRDLKSGMAVTAMAVVLDPADGAVTAASAGHRPIILWRQGKTATINPSGIALGLDIGPVFDKTIEDKRFSLQKNDRIVFYTDGVISVQNAAGESFGEERLTEAIRRNGGMNSAAFVNLVGGTVDAFLAGGEQNDDITISTLKRLK